MFIYLMGNAKKNIKINKKSKALDSGKVRKIVRSVLKSDADVKRYYHNSGAASVQFSYTPAYIQLTPVPAQGSGDDERVGDEIRLQYINLRLRLVGSNTLPDVARVIIFRWRPQSALGILSPTYDDIMYSLPTVDYQSSMSAYNMKNKQNYVILKDMFVNFGTNTNIRSYNLKINCRNIKQTFIGEDTCTNQIYMFIVGEGLPTGTYVYSSEVAYLDI